MSVVTHCDFATHLLPHTYTMIYRSQYLFCFFALTKIAPIMLHSTYTDIAQKGFFYCLTQSSKLYTFPSHFPYDIIYNLEDSDVDPELSPLLPIVS